MEVLNTLREWGPWGEALSALIFAVLAWAGAQLILLLLRLWSKRRRVIEGFTRRVRIPLFGALVVAGQQAVVGQVGEDNGAWRFAATSLRILLVIFIAWIVVAALHTIEDAAMRIYKMDVENNRQARRIRTRVNLVRRLTSIIVGLVATAIILFQFEAVQAAGTGILASAGVLSVVVGLAAQSTLANVFAGLQLTFSDALRVDDVVVVEDRWGNVAEIGLLAIVIRTWDAKMFLVPSVWFTQNPYENWTRYEAAVIGDVTMDLDWNVPVKEMRSEFERMIHDHDLWDEKVAVLQVTEAVGSFVQVRMLVSAKDGPTLFDLRCAVREHLVEWLRNQHPQSLPRIRYNEGETEPKPRTHEAPPVPENEVQPGARFFSGSPAAEQRAQEFATGPIPVIQDGAHPGEGETKRTVERRVPSGQSGKEEGGRGENEQP